MSVLGTYRRRSLRIGALVFLPLVLIPLLQYLGVARFGNSFFLWMQVLVLIPLLIALLVLVAAPFFLFVRRYRSFALWSLFLATAYTMTTLAGIKYGAQIRTAAFEDLAERSIPLVQAIFAYEARHGKPPPDLVALVPEFISRIPSTGMGAYPDYEYHEGVEAAAYERNPWVLLIHTSSGGINFDMFLYFPLQNYPRTGYGGRLERISDWAYVHE